MTGAHKLQLTYAQYLELERLSDTRHEYLHGEAWMMAGGSPEHSAIKSNLMMVYGSGLRGGPCRAYDSDLKVRVVNTGLATYPDLTVVCGKIERHPEDPNAITNPTVLFEVLSKATESWDRGQKFMHYQQIPTLAAYVLVGQDERRVEVYTRGEDGSWRYVSYGPGQEAQIPPVDLALPVDALYESL